MSLHGKIMKRFIVTGGAGFIGSALCRYIIGETPDQVCVIDKLSYAGNLENLAPVAGSERFRFEKLDINDRTAITALMREYCPDFIIHLAAESHVDRSIDAPDDFIQSNIVGTYNLLEAARSYWADLPESQRSLFRFHHVSTDEVFGDLTPDDPAFCESNAYLPSSPYSASKAASDHLVRAWGRTFGLPVLVTNCSNNYGPYQFPEKLIPLVILRALKLETLPVYGDGSQIRDWLYVEDHARALYRVATQGLPGETYNIGGESEMNNLAVVRAICAELDKQMPRCDGKNYSEQITFVSDRPGHDRRYAMNIEKIRRQLAWQPQESFASGMAKTVAWYLRERDLWCKNVLSGEYKMSRLGSGGKEL